MRQRPGWREGVERFLHDPMDVSPVFVREFRSRMRSPWAYWVLGGYLLALTPAALYFLYRFTALFATGRGVEEVQRHSQQVGVVFAIALFTLQVILITLLTPGLTCTAFTTERAKRQLTFVLLTPLPSRTIVQGKLLATLFFLMLVILPTVPLCALSSQFGGFSPFDLLVGYAALAMYALLVASFGLYLSARDPRGWRALLLGYLGVLGVPVLFPCLLVPVTALYGLLVAHDTVLITQLSEGIALPVVCIPLGVLFWQAARWFLGETAIALDFERRMWGTYAPPLPLHREVLSDPPPAAAAPPVSDPAPEPEPAALPEPEVKRKRW